MRYTLLLTILLSFTLGFVHVYAQDTNGNTAQISEFDANVFQPFRASETRYFDLIHTRLQVSFNWEQQHLIGEAEIQLKPHFLGQSELVLDAQGMDIHAVTLRSIKAEKNLEFKYDQKKLLINLDRIYDREDTVKIVIDYTAKPNDRVVEGSDAIKSDKGLYFINPLGVEKNKPRQIWTQGETQANSVWFPTLDAPNQRSTQEIYITVEEELQTLSNGILVESRINGNGTKTDFWKMDKSHAPYLFMLAVGEFSIVNDKWKDVPLNYYVEQDFEPYAKSIFGNTPEMMGYFSDLLGYKYPWPKYSQIVVRDYVSGAMENTSASVFMEALQSTDRELIDFNWDDIIAHELFHQWFGDLVTCESWSNLTLNEGFATYGEFLWDEHKNGRNVADYNFNLTKQDYLDEASDTPKNLVRYYYNHQEDMFDNHSYAKGALVLHMLRKYLGDTIFFEGLKTYLQKNEFSSVELANLRLAFEEISGEDLLWFFDQWFLFPGHPKLDVRHTYSSDTLYLEVEQNQGIQGSPLYRMPLFVNVWVKGSVQSYPMVIEQESEQYKFPMDSKPELVIFDAQYQLLAEIEHSKSDDELLYQYINEASFGAKLEVLESLKSVKSKAVRKSILEYALNDPFYAFRQMAIDYCFVTEIKDKSIMERIMVLTTDENSYVRAAALNFLGELKFSKHENIIRTALQDSSYTVIGTALNAYLSAEAPIDDQTLDLLERESNVQVILPLAEYYSSNNVSDKFPWFRKNLQNLSGNGLFYFIHSFAKMLIEAPEENRLNSVALFENLARNNTNYTVRLAAYQALLLQSDLKNVKKKLSEIRANEKDQRLLEVYNQMNFD